MRLKLGGLLAATIAVTAAVAPPAAAAATDHPGAQQAIEEFRAGYGAPGAVGVVRSSTELWSVTTGTREVFWNAPFTADHVTRIGSLSKPITSVIVLQLVAEGKVRLDEPVETYLPGVVTGNYDGRVITVRQLLNHTSGIGDHLPLSGGNTLADINAGKYLFPQSMATVASWGLERPAVFPPGQGWRYSGANYFLAGMIIEKVTGRTFHQELASRITTPLGMTRTSLPTVNTLPSGHVRGYLGAIPFLVDITEAIHPSIGGPAGGLVSTGADETTFFTALFSGKLLRPAELAEMTTTNPWEPSYGLGLEKYTTTCGTGTAYGHSGIWPGYYSIAGGLSDGSRSAFTTINALNGGGLTSSTGTYRPTTLNKLLCDGQ